MKVYILLLFHFFTIVLFAQSNSQFDPKIEYKIQENIIELNSVVINRGEMFQELNYLFLVVKKGATGSLSNQKQEGKFLAKQNQQTQLSKINLNFSNKDELKAYLFIRNEDTNQLIAKDSLILNFNNEIYENSLEDRVLNKIEFKEEEFVIRGLVSDHTKTRVGREFYDLFYTSYNLLNTKFPFLIEFEELPVQGRTSKVIVKAEDKVIYEFMLNPNEEYMKAIIGHLFNLLYAYDRNRNVINTY